MRQYRRQRGGCLVDHDDAMVKEGAHDGAVVTCPIVVYRRWYTGGLV
jgi:hypothetical protein